MRRGQIFATVVAAALAVSAPMVASAAAVAKANPNSGYGGSESSVLTRALAARMRGLQAHASVGGAQALAVPVPTMTVHDPKGDAVAPQGDLTGSGMLQNSSGTAFGVTVSVPVNPATDANWLSGATYLAWYIDTNLNDRWDDLAIMAVDPADGHLVAAVFDFNSNPLCSATPSYVAHVGYRLSAPAGCLPHLNTARFGACLAYTDDPTDQNPPQDCAPDGPDLSPPTVVQQAPPVVHHNGYWMLGADGHVYAFGNAVGYSGSVKDAVAMTPRADGKGYWVVDRAGHVFTYGSAGFYGGTPALGAGEFVSTISATPNGGGYWLFTNKGRAFHYGNAGSFGDMSRTRLNGPIVASVATPTGRGYFMVGSDGGIFSFGDARFHGSTGGIRLNKPVVGISPTPDSRGYWLVASDGGVFAFGAPFRGSMGGTKLNRPVDGLVAFGNGYLMAASDGGIFDFSNKPFEGSLAEHPPSAPIIGVAAFST